MGGSEDSTRTCATRSHVRISIFPFTSRSWLTIDIHWEVSLHSCRSGWGVGWTRERVGWKIPRTVVRRPNPAECVEWPGANARSPHPLRAPEHDLEAYVGMLNYWTSLKGCWRLETMLYPVYSAFSWRGLSRPLENVTQGRVSRKEGGSPRV